MSDINWNIFEIHLISREIIFVASRVAAHSYYTYGYTHTDTYTHTYCIYLSGGNGKFSTWGV